ncbi:MAG: orotate phosphoribosyltransferase [Coriobacteriales bacterium]|nr:orotate phosphoribosyltransferase [Coriobacteriales bacterium]
MTEQEILDKFIDCGAICNGHFKLSSGRHSNVYVQCQRLMEDASLTFELAKETLNKVDSGLFKQADLIVSPAIGGITWGFAFALASNKRYIFAERVDGQMTLRRNFTAKACKCLICEDVVTTGKSVNEVKRVVEADGGEVLGVVCLIDRGQNNQFDGPVFSLLKYPSLSWDPNDCELCKKGIEITAPGSRFLAK